VLRVRDHTAERDLNRPDFGEVDADGPGQPSAEAVVRRSGVDEAELGRVLEMFDLDGEYRSDKGRAPSW
jgi:hypothetical protein